MALEINQHEIEWIQSLKTWQYAQEIHTGGRVQGVAMFRLAGDVIKASQGGFQDPCVVLDGHTEWCPTSDHFLNNGSGKSFVTFDPPFNLMMEGRDVLVEDVPGFPHHIKVYYGIQFNMSEDSQKMQIFKAGIIFAQHVYRNTARLSTLATVLKKNLTSLSCNLAMELPHGCNTPATATWTNTPGTALAMQRSNALALDQPSDGQPITMTRLGLNKKTKTTKKDHKKTKKM